MLNNSFFKSHSTGLKNLFKHKQKNRKFHKTITHTVGAVKNH